MNREEYVKAKAEDTKAKRSIIDRVPPASFIPAMFVEKITRFEVTKDKLWANQRGELVTFGGTKINNEWKNKTVIMHPSFSQMLAEAGGVTQIKGTEIEKVYDFHDIPMGGKIIKMKYCSRVVGRISYRRLTDSASQHPISHTSEIDVDNLFAAADIKELERVGSKNEYGKEFTEKDTSFHTGNEYKDAVASYAKKIELGKYAYATLATRLKSHGVEKALGMRPLTDSDLGGVIYVSRITYDATDPAIQKMLVGAAVQDFLGVDAQKLISAPKESDATTEDFVNVTDEELPPAGYEADGADCDDSDIPSDLDEAEPPLCHKEEGPLKVAVIAWAASESVKNQICADFIEETIKSDESEDFYKAEIEAIKLLADGKEIDGIIALADSVCFMKAFGSFNEVQSDYVKNSVKSKDDKKCITIVRNMTASLKSSK